MSSKDIIKWIYADKYMQLLFTRQETKIKEKQIKERGL